MMEKSFAFVLNQIDVQGQLPLEVAPGHFFEKANADQVKKIKELLNLLKPSDLSKIFNVTLPSPYEINTLMVPGEKPSSFGYKSESLPENNWRYYIISFERGNVELEYVKSAASLLKHELELGFDILHLKNGTEGFGWNLSLIFSFFNNLGLGGSQPSVVMTTDELKEIPINYDLIKKIRPEHEHIKRTFRKWADIKSLPRNSELLVVGLFSIIESLVTHCPKLSESSDSLMHQIRTKIPLLSKRFQRKLNYGAYFEKTNEVNVWAKLYGYRSQIVHGEHSDLRGSLQVLKNRETVIEFLRETVKLLLLLALCEPVLLTDLKNC